ncbi:MAG: AtpZ/AtpI family protein [Candidatus Kapaibacterium sp.]
MSDKEKHRENYEQRFGREIESKSRRIIKGRNKHRNEFLFGLGIFGLVGWSVALPTVVGAAIGVWLDLTYKSGYSWTLMLIVLGVALGSMNAWYWVKKESERKD